MHTQKTTLIIGLSAIFLGILTGFIFQNNLNLTDSLVDNKASESLHLPEHPPNFTHPAPNQTREKVLKAGFTQFFDGYDEKIQTTLIHINEDGFRDRSYSVRKPDGTTRIIALGDSVTFGWGVNESDTWPNILERRLNQDKKENYEILNFGVWGYDTGEEVEMLREKGLKYSPDIVIVQYHRNDAVNESRLHELYAEYSDKIKSNTNLKGQKLELEISEKIYTQERRERDRKPVEVSMKPVREQFKDLREIKRSEGIEEVYIFGWPVDSEKAHYLKEMCESLNFTYIDTLDALNGEYNVGEIEGNDYRVADGHPNRRGHSLIARTVLRGLKTSN